MSKRPGDPGYSATWCIHFRDMHRNPTCEAEVNYDSLGPVAGRFNRLPCFTKNQPPGPGEPYHCPSFRGPTPAEIQAHEHWVADRMDRIGVVMVGIKPWREAHKGRSAAEIVDCPACNGRLHLTIAASNGHVHGRCETTGCVSWVE